MCHTKYKIPVNFADDNSYYPGINHSAERDVELEEYVYSIHKYVDWVIGNVDLHNTVVHAMGMPEGYFYAPYIPLTAPVDVNAVSFAQMKLVFERYANKIIKNDIQHLIYHSS